MSSGIWKDGVWIPKNQIERLDLKDGLVTELSDLEIERIMVVQKMRKLDGRLRGIRTRMSNIMKKLVKIRKEVLKNKVKRA